MGKNTSRGLTWAFDCDLELTAASALGVHLEVCSLFYSDPLGLQTSTYRSASIGVACCSSSNSKRNEEEQESVECNSLESSTLLLSKYMQVLSIINMLGTHMKTWDFKVTGCPHRHNRTCPSATFPPPSFAMWNTISPGSRRAAAGRRWGSAEIQEDGSSEKRGQKRGELASTGEGRQKGEDRG